ncbi:MAG TPA: dephospho-CoA kinase [Magnetospirillaceae bacterium]|jgi:dephospho-CoA kinase
MIVLGITGSIGMGKSVAAAQLRRLGIPVHDADAVVHALMAPGGVAVESVGKAFPGVVKNGAIDRAALGAKVFGDDKALAKLEGILHPLVRQRHARFIAAAQRRRLPLVALDIPLLFETGGEGQCDAVAVVSAPGFLQEQRVLKRRGMTPERLAAVMSRQMPDAEKRRWADYIVPTGNGRRATLRQWVRIVRALRAYRSTVDA